MRELVWPVVALLVAMLAFPVLVGPAQGAGPDGEVDGTAGCGLSSVSLRQAALPLVGAFLVPVLLAAASRGAKGWRGTAGLGVAVRAALGVGVVSMLLYFTSALVVVTREQAPAPAEVAASIFYLLGQLLFCVAAALLFESARLRAARREGVLQGSAMGEGTLIALVPLAVLGVLLGVVRLN